MTEDAKALVQRFYQEVSTGNLGVIDEMIAEDFIEHEEFPGIPPTRDGVKQFFGMLRSAFPDIRMEAEEIVVEGDMACARGRFTGTHEGDWMGLPPTGKSIDTNAIDMLRMRDGRFVEHWGVMDAMTMMQQLGAIPEQAPA